MPKEDYIWLVVAGVLAWVIAVIVTVVLLESF